ncbi:MAG TPA: hypothetical protein VF275_11995 [Gammaproteobacteria bacterium]
MQNHLPNQSPAGWLARVAGAIVSVIILAGLFFVGITVFAAVAGLAIVVFAVLAARVWWLRRKLRRSAARGETPRQERRQDRHQDGRSRPGGVTLEGEYEDRSPHDR